MAKIQINNPKQTINGGAKKYYFKVKGLGGPKGDKGDKGDTGSRGPQGPQGNAATVSVGSTTTLPVGYDATVTNSGSIYNAVLDFGIPQGPQGPQGAKGDKGDTGAQGETGPRGPQGEKGTNATVYVGTTTTTNPGTQARVYNSGTDSNAVLNFEIPRGDVGPQPELAQTTGTSTTKAMSQNATTNAINAGLATKQNTLTAGANIQISNDTISATDTTYTAGNGLNLNGTEFSADTTVLATKEDLESYYTKPETDNLLAPKLEAEVVAELPTTGEEGKLYLTPKTHTTQTATGNPITATVAEDAGALESFQLDGGTFQQSYTGKNLANPTPVSGGSNGVVATYNPQTGEATVSGTAKSTWSNLFKVADASYLTAGTYTLKQYGELTNGQLTCYARGNGYQVNASTLQTTFTTTSDGNAYICITSMTSGSPVSGTIKFQLESGSTATSYEPFVGGVPSPNPDYPQPIQTVTGRQVVNVKGKNLFVPPNSTTSRGVTFTKNEDGSFNISGKAVGGEALCSIFTDINLKDGESLTLRSNVGLSTGVVYRVEAYNENTWLVSLIAQNSVMPKTITIPQNATRLRYSIGLLEGREVNLTNVTFQLEKGTATTYEINLGKNLFNKNDVVNGIPSQTDGSIVSTTSVCRTSDYILVMPNTDYSHTGHPLGWATVAWYKADKSFIRRDGNITTITSPSEAAYARVSCTLGNLGTCQFEAGEPTDYAPYFEPIELCKLGTYQDYIWKDGESWKVHKETGEFVFTTETTPSAGRSKNGNIGFVIDATNNPFPNKHIPLIGACSCFTVESTTTTWTGINRTGVNTSGALWFQTGDSDNPDTRYIAQFFEWLAGSNATYNYALATPTDTTITDSTLIAQLEAIRTAALENGANTLTNTATGTNLAGDLEIGYYGYNPRNRYDKWLWLDLNNNYEQIGS